MKYVWPVLVLLYGVPAAAQPARAPRSVADCEVIKSDHAYNACLASFGPKAGEASVRGGAGYDDAPAAAAAPGVGTTAARRGAAGKPSGGRQAASFDVVSGRSRGSRNTRIPPAISFGEAAARGGDPKRRF
jgi:hypothetical protein